jgi:uncharacterized protein YbjT (DUF2867 family)
MDILVTGATGFVGSALIPHLSRDGHRVRAFVRDPGRLLSSENDEVVVALGDVLSGAGLSAALDGVQVAYYLIHSMEPSSGGAFPEHEQQAAHNFAQAATRAGVPRVIYLGGLLPAHVPPSRHLASRLAVERILLDASPQSIALRASIVIGARSRSFRFLVRLVERLPVLALPSWRDYRTAPIDARDLISYLLAAADSAELAGQTLDIAGPDILSYEEIIGRIAELMLVGRATVRLPFSATPFAARLAAAVTGERAELILPLMEGLEGDLLPRDDRTAALAGVTLHTFDSAVERALREWEDVESLAAD